MAKRITGEPENEFSDLGPDAGLPPIMPNDRVRQDPGLRQDPYRQQAAPALSDDQAHALTSPVDADPPEVDDGRRRGGGPTIGDVGYGWAVGARDFNPNGFRPNESRSAGVGPYQGSPLYAASLAFPDAVIASRQQAIAKKQAEIDRAMTTIAPELDQVDNPKYRDEHARWANGQIQKEIAAVKNTYGDRRGLKRLMTPGTKEYEHFRNTIESIDAVTAGANDLNKQALAVIKGMEDQTLEPDPGLMKAAKDYVYKTGTQAGATAREIAKSAKHFDTYVNFYDRVKNEDIAGLIKNATGVQDLVQKLSAEDPRGAAGFLTHLNTKTGITPDGLLDALTESWYRSYNGLIPKADIRRRFEALVPHQYLEKLSSKQIRASKGGSGSGPSNRAANYRVEATMVPKGTSDGADKDFAGGGKDWATVTLYGESNKQAKLANPMTFRQGGNESFMYPERIMRIHGKDFIIGKEVGMPRTRAEIKAMAKSANVAVEIAQDMVAKVKSDPQSPESASIIQRFGVLKPKAVPLEGNESQIEGLGYKPERIRKILYDDTERRKEEEARKLGIPSKIPAYLKEKGATQSQWDDLSNEGKAALMQTPEGK